MKLSLTSRLLKVGSIAHSMSVYMSAMLVQRMLGLARVVLLTYIISKAEMGHWGLGVMIFTIMAQVVTLGSNHGLVRYVSMYEADGQLEKFFRLAWIWVLCLAVLLTGVALVGSRYIFDFAIVLRSFFSGKAQHLQGDAFPWPMVLAILANIALLGLYLNLLGFIYGLRAYRLASLVEVLFSVIFTALVAVWVVAEPCALTLLLSHIAALVVTLIVGGGLLRVGVRRLSRPALVEAVADEMKGPAPMEPASDGDAIAAGVPRQLGLWLDRMVGTTAAKFFQVIKFGVVAMIGTFVWQGAGYVSYLMIYLRYGGNHAGPFLVFMQLSQPIVFLANASWAVLFSHVAKRWESNDRPGAMFVLETAYKAICLTVMTLTIVLYVTSPFWIKILDTRYQIGDYLSGLLTFFVMVSNMTMLTVMAKLHERPIVIALAALAGATLNVILALLWMPAWGEVGAARAAGVGMYLGGGMVMLVYLLSSGTRLHKSTYFILSTPALLLLPTYIVGSLWIVILPVCVFSPWVFDSRQKDVLRYSVRKGWNLFRGMVSWR